MLVVQDPFTSYYEAQVVADFVRLIEKLGFQPVLLPFSPNGKAQHIKGFLTRFTKTAKKTSELLNRVAQLGMPMVGVDPALVLCYRDEYKLALGEKRGDFHVMLVNEWLSSVLESVPTREMSGETWYFFGHCTEVTAIPARQHSGLPSLHDLAPNWTTSTSVVAEWRERMDMRRKTTKIR